MVKRMWVLVPGTAAAIACLAGCQSSATMQTTFARPYEQASLTKVFIVENLMGALDHRLDKPYEDFQTALTKGLQECGISSEFYRIDNTPLALDTQTKLQAAGAAAAKFGSGAILVVNETSKTIVGTGNTAASTVNYTFDLTDAKTRQGMWSARSTLDVHWSAGPKLAEAALDGMKNARVLRDCSPAKAPA